MAYFALSTPTHPSPCDLVGYKASSSKQELEGTRTIPDCLPYFLSLTTDRTGAAPGGFAVERGAPT